MITNKFKSQSEFARVANIPLTTLRSILEKGIEGASVNNAIKICNALNIDIEYLNPKNNADIKFQESFNYSNEDINLIESYRKASRDDKAVVDAVLRKYKEQKNDFQTASQIFELEKNQALINTKNKT